MFKQTKIAHEKPQKLKPIIDLIEERRQLELREKKINAKYSLEEIISGKAEKNMDYKQTKEAVDKFWNTYNLTPEEMHIITNVKKNKYPKLNLYVFAENENAKHFFAENKNENLKNFLMDLVKNSDSYLDKRFQIVFQQSCPNHWSAADILISKDRIRILNFDSIVSKVGGLPGSTAQILLKFLQNIVSKKPISLVECYAPTSKTIVQKDRYGCSIFALNAALGMSKFPELHDLVEEKSDVLTKDENCNLITSSINIKHLPARLLKNVQSLAFVREYEEQHNKDNLNQIGKNKLTLKEYTSTRSEKTWLQGKPFEEKKLINLGILFTREKYKEIVEKHKKDPCNTPRVKVKP